MKPSKINPDGRVISGVLESGKFGRVSSILDVETNSLNYKKKPEDADVLPYYFLFYIPQGTDEGILLLQRVKNDGIKTNLNRFLRPFFCKENPGFNLEMNALIREDAVKQAINRGTVKKLRCVKFKAPTDRVDGLDEGHKEVPLNMEIVLSASKIPIKNKLGDFLHSEKSNVRSLIELRDFNFDYDTVKAEIEVDGRMQTFDLGRIEHVRTHYEITDQVKLDANQQPTFNSIEQAAKRYLEEIIDYMYYE